jgi:glycosyltransferase involved in cell wall biosynthesis
MNTIIYLGGFRLPDNNGSAIRALGLTRTFQSLGFNVELGGKIGDNIDDQKYSDIKFWNIEDLKGEIVQSYKNINPIINKIEGIGFDNIKAIIAYNYSPIAFYQLFNYCKSNNIKLIQDITEWYSIDGEFTFQKLIRMVLTNWRIAILGPKTKNLIVSVNYLKRKFKKENCLVLPQLSLSTDFRENQNYLSTGDIIKFIYIGNPGKKFSKEKVDWCINIFSNLSVKYKKFSFEIVGIDTDYFSDKLKLLSKINKSDNIILHGKLSHKKALSLLKKSNFSVFFRPNTRVSKIGFPGKAREAFDCGVPILTNNTGDLSVYTKTNVNGYVINSFNEFEIQTEIEKILNKRYEDLNKVIKNCRSKNPFSPDIFNEKIMSFLNNLKTL